MEALKTNLRWFALAADRHPTNAPCQVTGRVFRMLVSPAKAAETAKAAEATAATAAAEKRSVRVEVQGSGVILGHVYPDGERSLYQLASKFAVKTQLADLRLYDNQDIKRVVPRNATEIRSGVVSIASITYFGWLADQYGADFAKGLEKVVSTGVEGRVRAPGHHHRFAGFHPVNIAGSSVLSYISGDPDWRAGDIDVYYAASQDSLTHVLYEGLKSTLEKCLPTYASKLACAATTVGTGYGFSDDIQAIFTAPPVDPHQPTLQFIVIQRNRWRRHHDRYYGGAVRDITPEHLPGVIATSMYDLDFLKSFVASDGTHCSPEAMRAIVGRSSITNLRRVSDLWRALGRVRKYKARGYEATPPTAETITIPRAGSTKKSWCLFAVLRRVNLQHTEADIERQICENFTIPYLPNPVHFGIPKEERGNRTSQHPMSETVTFHRIPPDRVDPLCRLLARRIVAWRAAAPEAAALWRPSGVARKHCVGSNRHHGNSGITKRDARLGLAADALQSVVRAACLAFMTDEMGLEL